MRRVLYCTLNVDMHIYTTDKEIKFKYQLAELTFEFGGFIAMGFKWKLECRHCVRHCRHKQIRRQDFVPRGAESLANKV